MPVGDSTSFGTAMDRARGLLNPPPRRDPVWPALVAATALAMTSIVFAAVMVMSPPAAKEHVTKGAPD